MWNVQADWQSIKVELYEMNMQNIIGEVKQYVDTCKMTKFGASMMRDACEEEEKALDTPECHRMWMTLGSIISKMKERKVGHESIVRDAVTIRIFPITGSGPRCPDSPGV